MSRPSGTSVPGGRDVGAPDRSRRMNILLVNMPFASVTRPALGISLLKSSLQGAGHECDVVYANVAFARLLGLAQYERIAVDLPHPLLAGEWAFTDCLYAEAPRPLSTYVKDVLEDRSPLTADDIQPILAARALAPAFIEDCLGALPWGKYNLVGFTSGSAQNVAALALAARVKAQDPDVVIAFGGCNWDEGMGLELHRRFSFVDFACSGEADRTLPALVDWLRHRVGPELATIPGIVFRHQGNSVSSGPATPVADLDTLPLPDYDDYFDALRANRLTRAVRPAVLAETCRGCWWAARHPCRFCGSPGCRRTYRAKSPARVLDEMRVLASHPSCTSIELVDDVPSPEFFDCVLPELAKDPLPVPLLCEVRPEVTREQIALLAASRASIQPGIESLSDHVLRLMHKGSRALENIRLLLWCRTYGVPTSWNLIFGVPGETERDYAQMARLLPPLRFLDPPDGCGPVRLDRFSVYAEHPEDYGLDDLEPLTAYRYLYPFPDSSLRRIAYAFEYAYPSGEEPWTRVRGVVEEVGRWQSDPETGAPRLRREPDGCLSIVDTRSDAAHAQRRLAPLDACVFAAAAGICSRADLQSLVETAFPGRERLDSDVDGILAAFLNDRLMVKDGDRYLSLALPEEPEGAAGRGRGAVAGAQVSSG